MTFFLSLSLSRVLFVLFVCVRVWESERAQGKALRDNLFMHSGHVDKN